MAKVKIAQLSDIDQGTCPDSEIGFSGPASFWNMIDRLSDSLSLYYVRPEPGSEIQFAPNTSDLCIYVIEGAVRVGEDEIHEGGSIIVEHGTKASLACPDSALCAVFVDHRPAGKSGGHVHAIDGRDVPHADRTPGYEEIGSSIIADAQCPSCDLWLHGNSYTEGYEVGLHSHSEGEIILVLDGEIVLGRKRYGPNTALAIAEDTIYGFTAGSGGMRFVNFRAGSPMATMLGAETPTDEGEFFRSRLGKPQHTYL